MKDNLAIFTSGLCLIHCLAAPLLLIIGLSGAAMSWFEANNTTERGRAYDGPLGL